MDREDNNIESLFQDLVKESGYTGRQTEVIHPHVSDVSFHVNEAINVDLACGPQEIELFIIKNAPARVNYPEALGLRHLAFKVESVDDTVKELNGKGIETEPVRLDDYTGKKMTFFHDPDGLPLEIHE